MKNQKEIPNKNILSIDCEDTQGDYNDFYNYLKNDTNRKKNKQAQDIIEMGNYLISEIEHKKNMKNIEKEPLIKYITSKTNKYSWEYLKELDFNNVNDIYHEIKYQNKSFMRKLIDFLFSS